MQSDKFIKLSESAEREMKRVVESAYQLGRMEGQETAREMFEKTTIGGYGEEVESVKEWQRAVVVSAADVMRKRGWTQAEVGKRMGMHPSHVSELFNLRKDWRISTIWRLWRALRVRPVIHLRERLPPTGMGVTSKLNSSPATHTPPGLPV